jgi:hypothetical protein
VWSEPHRNPNDRLGCQASRWNPIDCHGSSGVRRGTQLAPRGLLVAHLGRWSERWYQSNGRWSGRFVGPLRRDGPNAHHHEQRRHLLLRRTPMRDDRLGSAMDQKMGGEALRQPIGRWRGQNPETLPENEKGTPEGALFI